MSDDEIAILLTLRDQMSASLATAKGHVKAFGDATESEMKSVKASLDKANDAASPTKAGGLGHSLKGVATIAAGMGLAGGITKLAGFLKSAAQGAAEDEQATARLDKSIENMVRSSSNFVDVDVPGQLAAWKVKVDGAISSGQKLAFTDDEVRDSFQFLAQATGDGDEALRRLKDAQDLARGANIPLATATKMLGKLNEENIEVFKKMGIVLGEGATEADALAQVQARFGGQSEAYAKSTAGQFEIAKIKMAEMKESIGGALLPVMAALGLVLSDKVIPFLEKMVEVGGPIIQAVVTPVITGLGTVFGILGDHMNIVGPLLIGIAVSVAAFGVAVLVGLVPAFVAWAVAAGSAALATIAASLPVIAIIAAIALLVAGIIILYKNWDTLTEKYPPLKAASDAVKDAFEIFVNWITSTLIPGIKAIADVIIEVVKTSVAFVRDNWDTIRTVIESVINAVMLFLRPQIDLIVGIFRIIIDLFHGDFKQAWTDMKQMVVDILRDVWSIITANVDLIKGLFTGLWGVMRGIGGELVGGIKQGIIDKWDAFLGWAEGMVDRLPWAIKKALGIDSPSKVGIEIGQMFVQGIIVGMAKDGEIATNAARYIGQGISGALKDGMTVGGVGSGAGGFGTGIGGSQTSGMNASDIIKHLFSQLYPGGSTANSAGPGTFGYMLSQRGSPWYGSGAYFDTLAEYQAGQGNDGAFGATSSMYSGAMTDKKMGGWLPYKDRDMTQRSVVVNVNLNGNGYISDVTELATAIRREIGLVH